MSDGSTALKASISALRRRGQGAARPVKIGIEALDHRAVGKVRGRRRRGDRVAPAPRDQHRGDGCGHQQRGEEAEHADRLDEADQDRRKPDDGGRDPDAQDGPAGAGVEPLPLAPGGGANRAAAFVDGARDAIEPSDRPVDLVGDFGHFASMGVSGEAAPSSLAWFTPSARAI